MSKYHLEAVLHFLKNVRLSGEPNEIDPIYEVNLPPGQTLAGLVSDFGLTMKPSKSTGRWIIERPWLPMRAKA